ncbi:hypothetical protein CEUSTIGMA_g8514.t1 [Chlamydomonas eustigma]|uniref:Uncharacterized protein n=1 Tax=Chlamydomonas eustigma TaxID=1157962 RepID=A0A250XDU2_9CHLO|nr:hypothetical protein CEUSTIGMA_g8514.t1 [Chlamydomonas eustigma]|eukprot:GAX81079.1 hypothetical protein CEUSTIGMA_g8514.t1 [Chlamydomonas eustigma]
MRTRVLLSRHAINTDESASPVSPAPTPSTDKTSLSETSIPTYPASQDSTMTTVRQNSQIDSSSTSGSADLPSSTGKLAKEAWDLLNNEETPMTLRSLLGESNYSALQAKLGVDKSVQLAGLVDPVLKNRRVLTLATAVIDVLLIVGGIKLFQHVTLSL